jgi:hypothetical protein
MVIFVQPKNASANPTPPHPTPTPKMETLAKRAHDCKHLQQLFFIYKLCSLNHRANARSCSFWANVPLHKNVRMIKIP